MTNFNLNENCIDCDTSMQSLSSETVPTGTLQNTEKNLPIPENSPIFTQPQSTPSPAVAYSAPLNCLPCDSVIQLPRTQPFAPVYLGAIAHTGISFKQAQEINAERYRSEIRLREFFMKKNIELAFKCEVEKIKVSSPSVPPAVSSVGGFCGHAGSSWNEAQLDGHKLTCDFIARHVIVKIRHGFRAKPDLFVFHPTEHHHIPISENELSFLFSQHLRSTIPAAISPSEGFVNNLWSQALYAIPTLEDSGLYVVPNHQIQFKDGRFDLQTGEFISLAPERVFTTFAFPFNFMDSTSKPEAFDAVLADMFGRDSDTISLAYEYIGAMLSPLSNLKKIYVFQGCSNGGKSRLAEIICRVLGEENIELLDRLSDITQDALTRNFPIRLVYVAEAPDKKIPSAQAAALKSYAGGSGLKAAASFKILICTNHALVTGANGYLESGLRNRIAVLPFAKVMDNDDPRVAAFEDCHLEDEKPAIVRKALLAFHKVVLRGGKFGHEFPVNQCIEANLPTMTSDEAATTHNRKLSDFEGILGQHFHLTDSINDEHTSEKIMDAINAVHPGLVKNVNSLGRRLRDLYGEQLASEKNSEGKICYNLEPNSPPAF